MRILVGYILVLMILLSCAGCSKSGASGTSETSSSDISQKAQLAEEAKVQAEQKEAKEREPYVSFDLTLEALPKDFTGHDIKNVFYRINEKFPEPRKDEYETTAAYNERINKARSEFSGTIYAFVTGGPLSKYNADKQVLKFENAGLYASREEATRLGELPFNKYALPIIEESNKESAESYKKNTGKKTFYTDIWQLGLNEKNREYMGHAEEAIEQIEIIMSPDKAKALKDSTRILIICTPCAAQIPIAINELYLTGKTSLFIEDKRTINVDILDIWVFDEATGEILYKYSNQNAG